MVASEENVTKDIAKYVQEVAIRARKSCEQCGDSEN